MSDIMDARGAKPKNYNPSFDVRERIASAEAAAYKKGLELNSSTVVQRIRNRLYEIQLELKEMEVYCLEKGYELGRFPPRRLLLERLDEVKKLLEISDQRIFKRHK